MNVDAETRRLPSATGRPLPYPEVRALLASLGYNPDCPALAETPRRFASALAELTAGETLDPARHLKTTFPADADEMVMMRRVPFASLCEHHLLPFTGRATVAYIPAPGAGVVGISKLVRVVEEYARRLQMQERLTAEVADCIETHLDTVGVAVMLTAVHSCMTLRGVRTGGAALVTSVTRGAFRTDARARAEFFALDREG